MTPSHLNMQWLGRALRRVAGFQTRPSGKLGPMKPWTDDTATSSRSPHGSRPHRVRGASDRGTPTPAAERSTRADRIIHRAGCAPELAGRPPESAGTRSPTVSPAHGAEGRARFHASRHSRAARHRLLGRDHIARLGLDRPPLGMRRNEQQSVELEVRPSGADARVQVFELSAPPFRGAAVGRVPSRQGEKLGHNPLSSVSSSRRTASSSPRLAAMVAAAMR
jgi:hypothetical protein